jgi:hypothetical protein
LKRSVISERLALHQSSLAMLICFRLASKVGSDDARSAGLFLHLGTPEVLDALYLMGRGPKSDHPSTRRR